MEFRWWADDSPLLWYLDPLSPHQLKRHEISKSVVRVKREREREREHMVPMKLFHIILTSMLYKQLSACTLLLCDVK